RKRVLHLFPPKQCIQQFHFFPTRCPLRLCVNSVPSSRRKRSRPRPAKLHSTPAASHLRWSARSTFPAAQVPPNSQQSPPHSRLPRRQRTAQQDARPPKLRPRAQRTVPPLAIASSPSASCLHRRGFAATQHHVKFIPQSCFRNRCLRHRN